MPREATTPPRPTPLSAVRTKPPTRDVVATEPRLDPATRALETYIDASVEQLLSGDSAAPKQGLLFLSAWHESMPALAHLDPVLESVDSRVFAVLWIWAKQQGRSSTAFPSYDYLLQRCNIQSRATLARSLAILRITRWVTLCRRVRDKGRNRGNIYALHEEPLPLAATVYLDPGYMDFLQRAERHHHEHVAKVAQVFVQSLQASIDEGEDILNMGALSPVEQRLEAMATIAEQGSGNYFGLRRSLLSGLQASGVKTDGASDHTQHSQSYRVQNMNSGTAQKLNSPPVQHLNLATCSSKNNTKKTTTTARDQEDRSRASATVDAVAETALVYPESLSPNEQRLARMYLKDLDGELQQALLDELSGKIKSQAKTARPVRNAIGLLCWMCNETKAGRPPLTSTHLKHRERRDRERALQAHIEAEQQRLTEMARAAHRDGLLQ